MFRKLKIRQFGFYSKENPVSNLPAGFRVQTFGGRKQKNSGCPPERSEETIETGCWSYCDDTTGLRPPAALLHSLQTNGGGASSASVSTRFRKRWINRWNNDTDQLLLRRSKLWGDIILIDLIDFKLVAEKLWIHPLDCKTDPSMRKSVDIINPILSEINHNPSKLSNNWPKLTIIHPNYPVIVQNEPKSI